MCDEYIKPKSKYKHFKSKYHEKIDKSKHITLTLKDTVINDVDETFQLYIIEHNKKSVFYLVKCQFK